MGKPLPGRLNIVLSRQTGLNLPDGVLLVNDLQDAIKQLETEGTDEAFVIGGGKVFEEAMPLLDRLYFTEVKTTVEGADVFFPHVDHSHWKLVWEEAHTKDEKHAFDYTFKQYEHINL
jgi:dihydrofolate reductase